MGALLREELRPRLNAREKAEPGSDPRILAAAAMFPVVAADRVLVLDSAATAERHQLSIFDAAIVRAAARAGCEELLGEDFSDGQVFGSVRVRNPF